jgi:hypothetical protein
MASLLDFTSSPLPNSFHRIVVAIRSDWKWVRMLKECYFVDDKIAFFDIPALNINMEADDLVVLRGDVLG